MEKDNEKAKKWNNLEGFPNVKLPWWTELVIAQRSGTRIPPTHICHLHHCVDCARIIVCSDVNCRHFQMSCPDCYVKLKGSKKVVLARRIF